MGSHFAAFDPDAAGSPADIVVAPLCRAHLEACVALAVQREGGGESNWRAVLERSLASEHRATFVAVLDDRVAGYGTAGWFEPGRDAETAVPDGWYLLGLVVDPPFRRRGVGRALTLARLDWVRARGRRARYFTSSTNRASVALHSALGFQLVADDIAVPGVSFTGRGQLHAADLWPGGALSDPGDSMVP